MHTRTSVCMYIYIYIYKHIYVYIYIYICVLELDVFQRAYLALARMCDWALAETSPRPTTPLPSTWGRMGATACATPRPCLTHAVARARLCRAGRRQPAAPPKECDDPQSVEREVTEERAEAAARRCDIAQSRGAEPPARPRPSLDSNGSRRPVITHAERRSMSAPTRR